MARFELPWHPNAAFRGIALDADANIYVALMAAIGTYVSPQISNVSFMGNMGSYDVLLFKLASSGSYITHQRHGGNGWDDINSPALDSLGYASYGIFPTDDSILAICTLPDMPGKQLTGRIESVFRNRTAQSLRFCYRQAS
jgi:hypothetical protein